VRQIDRREIDAVPSQVQQAASADNLHAEAVAKALD
jgi:hypothetical protein